MNINSETELKQFEDLIVKVKDFAESFVDTVHEPFLLMNKDKKIMYANKGFYDNFQGEVDETIGTVIYDIGNRQWDIPKLRLLLDEILIDKKAFKGFHVEHDFPTIGQKIMVLNARIIYFKDKPESIILLAIEDITEIKKKENELKECTEELMTKAEEFEIFLNTFVGHELRMMDLKTIIRGLQAEIESLEKVVPLHK